MSTNFSKAEIRPLASVDGNTQIYPQTVCGAILDLDAKLQELPNTALDEHIADTSKHLTDEERQKWNQCVTVAYVDGAIQSAIQNTWEASY